MYKCKSCGKKIDQCPSCKAAIEDKLSFILSRLSMIVFFLAVIFFALGIQIKEQTTIALRPFTASAKSNNKKVKVKETKDPSKSKKEKAKAAKKKKKKKNKKKKKKGSKVNEKDADFRVGIWGMSKKKIKEAEKAEPIEILSGNRILEYKAKVGNYPAIVQYHFRDNKLVHGNYIVIGDKLAVESGYQDFGLIGESCPNWVARDMALYKKFRVNSLNNLSAIDTFFYELYVSMSVQYGASSRKNKGIESVLSRRTKVKTVLGKWRMLKYRWRTERSDIALYFACYNGIPYFKTTYRDVKANSGLF